jgi:hypothetical protein
LSLLHILYLEIRWRYFDRQLDVVEPQEVVS